MRDSHIGLHVVVFLVLTLHRCTALDRLEYNGIGDQGAVAIAQALIDSRTSTAIAEIKYGLNIYFTAPVDSINVAFMLHVVIQSDFQWNGRRRSEQTGRTSKRECNHHHTDVSRRTVILTSILW